MSGFMEYTKRRNLNRGYMKLEVWQRGIDLFEMAPAPHQVTGVQTRNEGVARVAAHPTNPTIHQSNNPLIPSTMHSRCLP
jgi:hypothetical protein